MGPLGYRVLVAGAATMILLTVSIVHILPTGMGFGALAGANGAAARTPVQVKLPDGLYLF